MHGIEQGIMGGGRELGRIGIRFAEDCGGLGALEIVLLVLGLLLWAAVMTTLVMVMIMLVRKLRQPGPGLGVVAETAPGKAKGSDKKKSKGKGSSKS